MWQIILLLGILISSFSNAQDFGGIKWVENLTWDQIKAKAQAENKYIFIDAFTTWCGPCKQMDKYVYNNDTVGKYFMDKFISIKVQMDQTSKDNENIKNWYANASAIGKEYKVYSYPTFIFLSPSGVIVHKETGFKGVNEFINIAQAATMLGKTYDNPYAEYDTLVAEYFKGKKNYTKMPYMFKVALSLGNEEVVKNISKDYNAFIKNLKSDELYTKDNIEYLSTIVNVKSSYFSLFFSNGQIVDSVMRKKGFAQNIVDGIILREVVAPFLDIKIGGVNMMGSRAKQLPDPDWKKLYKIIKEKYTKTYANRNLLDAKIEWYEKQRNYQQWAKSFILRYRKYGVDKPDMDKDIRLNWVAWQMFLRVTNNRQLKVAIKWMEGVVSRSDKVNSFWHGATTDTYANLHYKIGKKEKAIQLETRALEIVKEAQYVRYINSFENTLNKMKNGKPTWLK